MLEDAMGRDGGRTGIARRGLGAGLLAAAIVLGGPAAGTAVSLRIGQPAPEITGERWINSEPLSMAGLRGRVVLVEFWTYG
jgi:hypothetical protein